VIAPLLVALVAPGPASPPLVVSVEAPAVRLASGERGEIRVIATIRKGFRIQANPASEPFLVPAQLELEPDERLRLGPPEYPRGEAHRLRGASTDLSVYRERLVIRVPVEARAAPGGPGDEVVLDGRLRYQACNEVVCLRPTTVPVRVRLNLSPGPPARH
jgi:hypothetical protein